MVINKSRTVTGPYKVDAMSVTVDSNAEFVLNEIP